MKNILLAALCIFMKLAVSAQESAIFYSPELAAHIQAEINPSFCNEANGEILINAVATQNLTFSLNGLDYQNENIFTDLKAGHYTIFIKDSNHHSDSLTLQVGQTESLQITDISSSPSACGEQTGKLLIESFGGKQPISYSINNGYPQREDYFDELSAGSYHIRAIDANGCTVDTIVSIAQTGCQVYIPNIFSPNGDGVNDYFQIQTADENNVMITRFLIFDRWGSKVYEKYDLPIHSSEGWWDGTYKRFTMNRGNFAYFVEVEFENGDRETFRGNVTLLR